MAGSRRQHRVLPAVCQLQVAPVNSEQILHLLPDLRLPTMRRSDPAVLPFLSSNMLAYLLHATFFIKPCCARKWRHLCVVVRMGGGHLCDEYVNCSVTDLSCYSWHSGNEGQPFSIVVTLMDTGSLPSCSLMEDCAPV